MYLYNVENNIPPTLVMEGPEYILPNDRFNFSCKGTHLVRATLKSCLLLSQSSQRVNGESCVNLHIEHVKEPCKIACFSGAKVRTEEIPVIGT